MVDLQSMATTLLQDRADIIIGLEKAQEDHPGYGLRLMTALVYAELEDLAVESGFEWQGDLEDLDKALQEEIRLTELSNKRKGWGYREDGEDGDDGETLDEYGRR